MKLLLRPAQFIQIPIFFHAFLKLNLLLSLLSIKALKLNRKTVVAFSCHEKKRVRGTGHKPKRLPQGAVDSAASVTLVGDMDKVAASLRIVVP